MAYDIKRSNAAVNAEANNVCALLNTGYLRIYDGTKPATADTAVTTQVLLAELRFGSPAFGSAANGVATANTITKDSSANATGTASWFRALSSDGTSAVLDGTVGTSGCDMNLASVAIATGAEVDITAFTYNANKG